MTTPERQKYKIAGPATWELIRAAYLAGESAPALAERFGVSAHAIRKRITVEKWSKRAYAEALEARGLEAPARPKTLNVAERFAANYAPLPAPPVSQAEEHPFMALVAALKEAAAAAESGRADIADALTEQSASETAAQLERRALAQASAAVTKGRASDAKAFAALAEQMRKLAADDSRAEANAMAAEADAERAERQTYEAELIGKFMYGAYLAYCMVHNPQGAPAIFVDCIAAVRRDAFGEGDEESLAKARASAAEARRYFGLDEQRWDEALAAAVAPVRGSSQADAAGGSGAADGLGDR